MNPIRLLRGEEPPAPGRAVVSFEWEAGTDDDQRNELESQYGLRVLQGPGAEGRWRYEVRNAYDPALLKLEPHINNAEGLEWERLEDLNSRLPTRAAAALWLQQISLLVPLLLLVSAGMDVVHSRRRAAPIPLDTYRIVGAAAFLAVIDSRLFREPAYALLVAPVTAALGARFLVWPAHAASGTVRRWSGRRGYLWAGLVWAVAAGMLVVTGVAAVAYARQIDGRPAQLLRSVGSAFAQLLASPPVDGVMPRDAALRIDREAWQGDEIDKGEIILRYLHDCTQAGDRVFVTGSTPYSVGYYIERSVAGGHLFWHHEWRSDPIGEARSLALLQKQSVPFAFSTTDPVLHGLERYPRIREYFMTHYTELEGSGGLVLIDTRRQPTGEFGTLGFPCFR